MKNIILSLTILLLGLNTFGQSQEHLDSVYKQNLLLRHLIDSTSFHNKFIASENAFNNAEYVFEGVIINTDSYYNDKNKQVITIIVDIKKVYRGNLKPGLVEIINAVKGQAPLILEGYVRIPNKFSYDNSSNSVFFCNKSKSTYNPKYNIDRVDNKEILTSDGGTRVDMDDLHPYSSGKPYPPVARGVRQFYSRSQFYEFLKKLPNIDTIAVNEQKFNLRLYGFTNGILFPQSLSSADQWMFYSDRARDSLMKKQNLTREKLIKMLFTADSVKQRKKEFEDSLTRADQARMKIDSINLEYGRHYKYYDSIKKVNDIKRLVFVNDSTYKADYARKRYQDSVARQKELARSMHVADSIHVIRMEYFNKNKKHWLDSIMQSKKKITKPEAKLNIAGKENVVSGLLPDTIANISKK